MRVVGGQNENSVTLSRNFEDKLRKEHMKEILELVSLRCVPLEVRRKEAGKPLFLTRYE